MRYPRTYAEIEAKHARFWPHEKSHGFCRIVVLMAKKKSARQTPRAELCAEVGDGVKG